ncbi:MAG: YHS domain-containing protein [Desulfobacterales bacterium]|nr:MAG: YHS domain-containing protein [Desulfobacterales bacterium]
MKVLISLISMLLVAGLLVTGPGCKKSTESNKTPAVTKVPTTTTAAKIQTICPVEGGKIDKNVYVDYQGKRVYFCCADCKAKFNADSAKYVKQMEDKAIVLEKISK